MEWHRRESELTMRFSLEKTRNSLVNSTNVVDKIKVNRLRSVSLQSIRTSTYER